MPSGCFLKDGGTIVVFENSLIVKNLVGLLDVRDTLSALQYDIQLRSDSSSSSLCGHEVRVVDSVQKEMILICF